MTAGELAQHTGLTTASVTSLIHRLEARGFVERVRDIQDRRKVNVRAVPEKLKELFDLFGTMVPILDELIENYDDRELKTILDFLTRATRRSGSHRGD